MSLVQICSGCDRRIVVAESKGTPVQFDAPEKGVLEELAPGRPMMPDSLRLVVFGTKKGTVMPRGARAIYLNLHRCR